MLEGSELGAIRQFRSGTARVSEDPARGYVAGEVPLAARGGEVIVYYASSTGAGMKDSIVSSVDRDVIHAAALAGEQHQISRFQGGNFPRQGPAGTRLLARRTG
jgi:hypothetical protein